MLPLTFAHWVSICQDAQMSLAKLSSDQSFTGLNSSMCHMGTQHREQLKYGESPVIGSIEQENCENSFLKRQRNKDVKAITGTGESKLSRDWVGVHVVKFQNEKVPTEPPEGAKDMLRDDEQEVVDALKLLFEERPLWLRGPAEERLREKGLQPNVSTMQKTFICVSYLWSDGPWRQVYIRLGYDPRQHTESRFMQVIDFRDRFLKERRAYFERVQGTFDQTPAEALDCHFRTPPVNRSQLYQYIDIEDEVWLLNSSEILEECSFKTGWLPQKTLDAIRERMSVKAELLRRTRQPHLLQDASTPALAEAASSSGKQDEVRLLLVGHRSILAQHKDSSPNMFARTGMIVRRVAQLTRAQAIQSKRVPHAAALVMGAGIGGLWAKPAWCLRPISDVLCKEDVNWDEDSSYDGATPGPLLLRLAWHSAGTFCGQTKTGGSNGATMRFEPEVSWGANAGLKLAQQMLEPVKKKFPAASYSDLWIYAACVAIEEMGGEKVPFAPGRKDKSSGSECPAWDGPTCKDGRLPSADMGSPDKTASHLRLIFNSDLDFDWQS
eukprot:s3349_g2.t1